LPARFSCKNNKSVEALFHFAMLLYSEVRYTIGIRLHIYRRISKKLQNIRVRFLRPSILCYFSDKNNGVAVLHFSILRVRTFFVCNLNKWRIPWRDAIVTERKKHDARKCENCTLFLRRPVMRAVLLSQAEESGCERVNSGVLLFVVKPASKPVSITVMHKSKYDDSILDCFIAPNVLSAEQERRHRCESTASS